MSITTSRPMTQNVFRVLVRLRVHPGKGQEFESIWRDIADQISRNPANLGQWLSRSADEDCVYYITSDWVSEKRFREFEHSPEHAENRRRIAPCKAESSMSAMTVACQVPPRPASERVRVMLHLAEPGSDPGAVENGYHQISRKLAGRHGLRGNELLRAMDDPRKFMVLSDWADRESYIAWRDAPEHLPLTAPLRPYWAGEAETTFGVYEVVASY
jgi:heme-degrading monooxygenase HmoA